MHEDLLRSLVKKEFKGYDPYDALNSKLLRSIPSKIFKLGITQIFVYSPLNFRMILGVKKGINPKGLGLVLQALCRFQERGKIDKSSFDKVSEDLYNGLKRSMSKGYSGACWGFNFPWQDLTRFSEAYIPTIVNTTYVGNGLLDLCQVKKEKDILDLCKGARDFILKDLSRYENENGICFSYTPIDNNVVHNASLLGASFLSRLGSITGDDSDRDLVEKALNFSLAYQRENGSWPYSLDPKTGNERMQVDFHQGFNIDCILQIMETSNLESEKVEKVVLKGADFYFKEQFQGGRSLWRYPKRWPVDIHHQAQGIITASKMYNHFGDEKYLEITRKIMKYTLDNFQKRNGTFSYQKWPMMKNRINYTRWADSWMLLAMSHHPDPVR